MPKQQGYYVGKANNPGSLKTVFEYCKSGEGVGPFWYCVGVHGAIDERLFTVETEEPFLQFDFHKEETND